MEDHRARVERLAYELWERDGRPEGAHHRHWVEAERQIEAEARGDRVGAPRPASDTPTTAPSHRAEKSRPDVEPAIVSPAAKPAASAKPAPRQPAPASAPRPTRKGAASKRESVT